MKQKLKISNLVFKNNAYFTVVASIIAIVIAVISFLILSNLPSELTIEYTKNLDNNVLFISGNTEKLDVSGFNRIFTYTENGELENYNVKTGLDFSTFKINDSTSSELISQLSDWKPEEIDHTKIYPNYTADEVETDLIPNDTYNIPYFLAGSYPSSENEIVVGELIANLYVEKFNLKSYDELIGKNVDLIIQSHKYKFTISGISAGNKDILISSDFKLFRETQPKEYAYYREFKNKKEKENYVDSNDLNDKDNGITYYESRNYNRLNIPKIIIIITILLVIIVYSVILYTPIKELQLLLRYYNSQKFWYYIYLYPTIIIVVIVLIYILLLKLV